MTNYSQEASKTTDSILDSQSAGSIHVRDPTQGSSLVRLLSNSFRRNPSSRHGHHSQDSMSSLGNSLSLILDDLPKVQNYESRNEWFAAMLDQSLQQIEDCDFGEASEDSPRLS